MNSNAVSRKLRRSVIALFLPLLICATTTPAHAVETWEKLDKKLKQQIFQLNVGLKLHSKDGWIYLSDLSKKYHFPVFSTLPEDKGYRVVGFGSSFPVRTSQADKTYFVTSRHVLDDADGIQKECQRFFAAMRLHAEQTGNGNPEARYKQLLQTVNLSIKKDLTPSERATYQSTVDAIWDTYENNLSMLKDPTRASFNKYAKQSEIEGQVGYFLHPSGPTSQPPLEAKLYKASKENEPDLAILTASGARTLGMDFETLPANEGQEIQVIGYPVASDAIDAESSKYYAPTFSTGRVSRVTPNILQVDAPITSGSSGGPVVSLRGRVLGVVALRALSNRGGELPNFGGAITIKSVRSFAPELFGRGSL